MPPKRRASGRPARQAPPAHPPTAQATVPAATAAADGALSGVVVLDGELLGEARALIAAARQHVAQSVNATLVLLYWELGAPRDPRSRPDIWPRACRSAGRALDAPRAGRSLRAAVLGHGTPDVWRSVAKEKT